MVPGAERRDGVDVVYLLLSGVPALPSTQSVLLPGHDPTVQRRPGLVGFHLRKCRHHSRFGNGSPGRRLDQEAVPFLFDPGPVLARDRE
jgi:hypothetical protein